MKEFLLVHAQALYLRFCVIYEGKFVKPHHTHEFKKMWYEEWRSGLRGIDVGLIKRSLDKCRESVEWPPLVGEFRLICEQYNGLPDVNKALLLAIHRDFNHPVVSMSFEKVGSWAMKNDKQEVLLRKFKTAYTEAINTFRENPVVAWKQLEEFNDKPRLLEPPATMDSGDIIGWRERVKNYMEMAAEEKAKLNKDEYAKKR